MPRWSYCVSWKERYEGGNTPFYVDDIVVTSNDGDERNKLKAYMRNEFEIKDLGALEYFLGIEVLRSENGIVIL